VTNIAKLHELYPDEQSKWIRALYIHGVGTLQAEQTTAGFEADESVQGLAFATGPQGGAARIEFAHAQLRDVLAEHRDLKSITFDVFGFSRGAALARHFVNLIQRRLPELALPPQS
jgi:uncharacterized protein (DUF2235 family)